jgi:hypothetical protein
MWHPFKKKKLPKETVNDNEMENARKLIDSVFYPKIEKDLKVLNNHLADQKIQVGIEITWIFQKIE